MNLDGSGVYILKKEGVPVYVGKSMSLDTRVKMHRRSKYDEVEYFPMAFDKATIEERKLIFTLQPLLNKNGKTYHGAEGREICERVRNLRKGQFFHVDTKQERAHALNSARFLGKLITTRSCKEGGFTVYAI